MMRHELAAMQIVMANRNVATFFARAGGGRGAGNSGFISIRTVPKKERKESLDDIVAELRPKLNAIPGVRVYIQIPPPINIGGRGSSSSYQYTMFSSDTSVLYAAADKMLEKMRQMPGLSDAATDLLIKNPTVVVDIDRQKAAALGLNVMQVEDALYSAYGTRQVSTIYATNNTYQVIMELEPEFQASPSAVSMLYVRSGGGQLVPLNAVASLKPTFGPTAVNHSGQLPSVTISFALRPGYPLGSAFDAITKVAKSTLPSTVSSNFQGTAQAFQSSLQGLGLLLIIAIAVIYMVLGILYESFIHPLTILSALPFAGFGALLTLMLFRVDLSIYAFVGIIMLVGLVKKNAIMMIDFALDAERKEGKPSRDAIVEACLIRFRPIMMTTMAALMGTLPIAIGFGSGSEARRPLGLAVVGGLAFSQLVTLYVTPVIYTYLDAFQRRLGGRKAGLAAPPEQTGAREQVAAAS